MAKRNCFSVSLFLIGFFRIRGSIRADRVGHGSGREHRRQHADDNEQTRNRHGCPTGTFSGWPGSGL
jgi:hypothetical protein